MLNKIGRFIGAVFLAFIVTAVVNGITMILFGSIAHVINNIDDLTFWRFIMYIIIFGIAGNIIFFIAMLLGMGLYNTSRGSKFIAIIVSLIFLNGFFNDCVLLLGDSTVFEAGTQVVNMIKRDAGAYYKIGAIFTLVLDFIILLFYSLSCFSYND